MGLMDQIVERAKGVKRHVVLAEGEDPRVAQAAVRAVREGLADATLVGRADKVKRLIGSESGVNVVDPSTSELRAPLAQAYFKLRQHKGVDLEAAREAVLNPLNFAAMMVREGHADGTIAGAVATTGDTIRAALQCIGTATGVRTVSSFFLMAADAPRHDPAQMLLFSDCGLVVEPNAEELTQIALSSAASWEQFMGEEARVALLSFSTKGSARHARVDHLADVLKRVKSEAPKLKIDGELQFDAAFVPDVAASKAPGSDVAGRANVFVFPNLEAGNTGYKIAQRLGGLTAVGPVLQGLAKPANDLSRGCTSEDVFYLIAVTALQVT